MFNLLPNDLKQRIRSEYNLHLIVVALASVLFLQISFFIFLLPSWFISIAKEKDVVLQVATINKFLVDSKIEPIVSTIDMINTKLDTINSVLEYPKVTPFIDSIVSRKTKDILINEIFYTSSGKTTGVLSLSGNSSTRESLVLFVKKLEETKLFENVDLPISNFAKDKDIKFSINMTIKQ